MILPQVHLVWSRLRGGVCVRVSADVTRTTRFAFASHALSKLALLLLLQDPSSRGQYCYWDGLYLKAQLLALALLVHEMMRARQPFSL